MVYDSLVTRKLVAEIREHLTGVRADRIFLPAEQTAVLEFGRKGPLPQLLFSWQPDQARAHLTSGEVPAPGLTASFCDVLRRYLRGARLLSCVQRGFDRVLELAFDNAEGLGPDSRCTLILEPIGRWANAALLDPEGIIRECARHVPASVNRYRVLLPGERYYPPPGSDLPPLTDLTPDTLRAWAAERPQRTLKKLLSESVQGAGPVLLAELWSRSGLDPDAPAEDLPPDWAETLTATIREVLSEADAPGGWLYRQGPGRPLAYPVRLQSLALRPAEPVPLLSAALADLVRSETSADRARETRERLQGAAARALAQVEKRRRSREAALAAAAEADRYRDWGEALLANLWRLRPGQSEAEIPLYTPEGERLVTVPLNPNYSPQDNAQAYFDRYKKARRAVRKIPALLRADRREEEYLHALLQQIEDTSDEDDLAALTEELLSRGYLKRPRARRRPLLPARPFHRTRSPQGFAVWYGRTGLQNDRALRAASADDLWLHVRQGPGGHVIIRTGGRPDQLPPGAVEWAARLAAALSPQRADAAVEVAHTLVKHVRKPPGNPPGFVLYDRFTSLFVAPLVPLPGETEESG